MKPVKSFRRVPQLHGTIKHKGQIRSFTGCLRIIRQMATSDTGAVQW